MKNTIENLIESIQTEMCSVAEKLGHIITESLSTLHVSLDIFKQLSKKEAHEAIDKLQHEMKEFEDTFGIEIVDENQS